MNRLFLLTFLLGSTLVTRAQKPADTLRQLPEVTVKAYFSRQPLLRSPSSVGLITASDLKNQPQQSLVAAFNTLPGVRMEERSPGSYRLSVRGSLLRSPFGIRNVKIYLDDMPLTDAGGNTYLNILDASGADEITVLKGAEASIYGANTGGTILINSDITDSAKLSASLSGGSFGLFQQHLSYQKQFKNYQTKLKQAYQTTDGYRDNNALKRFYAQWHQQWDYRPSARFKSLVLYSNLDYATPGGLTELQAQANPKAARPASATLPGAAEQQAGVQNKTLLGGLTHEWDPGTDWKHVGVIWGTYTDFKNPFITNFETRIENTVGLRTYGEYGRTYRTWNWTANAGLEAQQTASNIRNSANRFGEAGELQAHDKLRADQAFLFAQWSADFLQRWRLEASTSYTLYNFRYHSFFPAGTGGQTERLKPQLMPRLAAAYQLNTSWGWRASVSRGYSPPTIAEIRASDNVINTALQPENGWNYETGIRFKSNDNRFYLDGSLYYFALKKAIVRRVNAADAEYFINAGGTQQAGAELLTISRLIPERRNSVVTSLQLRGGYSYQHFRFADYLLEANDYSGNGLTGVPRHVVTTSAELGIKRLILFGQHHFTSSIPLNDANSAYAKGYHLVQLKASWRAPQQASKFGYEIFAGADNVLNSKYSLGNDLNAAGGRYFNPAAERNYYAGIAFRFR